jgi:putative endonuclease
VLGERIAACFLAERGAEILGRNVRVGRGELDLIVAMAGRRVAVEVKTAIGEVDPIHQFDDAKAHQVRALAAHLRIPRVDYVGVAVSSRHALVRWLPGIV